MGFHAGDTNLTRYAKNSVIFQFDGRGFWDERVHKNDTTNWAVSVGFSSSGAKAIGAKDIATDSYVLTTPILPWPSPFGHGNQSYHFNTYSDYKKHDSRLTLYTHYNKVAKDYCACPDDNPSDSVYYFGIALHAYQDIEAHGHFGRGYLFNQLWSAHNSGTPYAGQTWKTPDDPEWDAVGTSDGVPWDTVLQYTFLGYEYAEFEKKGAKHVALRWVITKNKTIETLKEFRGFISAEGGPNCKKFFL